MAKKIPENLKATIAFGISSFATSGINYIVTPIITRMMSVPEYGLISVYNSVYAIISVIATLTLIKPGLLSVGMYEHKENRWRYLSSMMGLITISSLATGVIIAVFWPFLKSVIRLPIPLVFLTILTCWLNPAFVFWTYKQKYEYNYKITFLVTIGTALGAQLVSIASIYLAKRSGRSFHLGVVRLWSAAAVNLLVAAVLAVYIVSKGKKLVDTKLWKTTLLFALPLIPHYLGFAFLNGTDKIMIEMMVGMKEAGVYGLAAVISTVGSLLWAALCVTVTPFINEMLGRKTYGKINKNVCPLLLLIGLVCLMVTLLAPEVIWVLGSKKYMEGIYVVPATVAGVFMHIVYDVFSYVAFFHKKTVKIMTATLTAALVNIILNYIFIRQISYVAASYTTLISFALLAVLHYRNMRTIVPEKIFDLKTISLLAAGVTAGCLACNFLYAPGLIFQILRYVLLAGICGVIVWKYRLFIDAIVDMKV